MHYLVIFGTHDTVSVLVHCPCRILDCDLGHLNARQSSETHEIVGVAVELNADLLEIVNPALEFTHIRFVPAQYLVNLHIRIPLEENDADRVLVLKIEIKESLDILNALGNAARGSLETVRSLIETCPRKPLEF